MTSSTTPGSPLLELPSPLAVVCHDAGAANLVLAWLEAMPAAPCRSVMRGPAAALAARSVWEASACDTLAQALSGAAAVLTGTGWASDLEHKARALARERGIFSVAVLDHWVNYRERFVRAGATVWPDEFWVADDEALAEAQRCFPGAAIRRQPNMYQDQLVRAIPDAAQPAVLYLLEPARSDWGRGEPGEFQALDYFMRHLAHAGIAAGTPVRLRPHPSDPPGKYDAWLSRHPGTLLDTHADLAAAIGAAQWVAGCETAALPVALAAGRRVVCTLPPWAPACRLPQRGLIHLKRSVSDHP